jgi:uncharacterized protein (TIRG00374 family)
LKKNIASALKVLFFLGLGIFFIWLFLRNLTPEQKQEIIVSLRHANYWWIIAAMFVGILSHAIRARRWMILMEPLGYKPRYINVFFAVFIGYFANLALPRLGEVSRCGVLTRYEKVPFNKSFGTVITERALDMGVFLLLFLVNLVAQASLLQYYIEEKVYKPFANKVESAGNKSPVWIYVLAALAVLAVVFYIFRQRFYHLKFVVKIRDMILGFLEGMKSLLMIKRPFEFALHTFLIWFCYFLMTYLVFFSLPATSGLGLGAGLAVLVFGSIGIILVQGGIGVYPAIVAETLFIYHILNTTGYAMGWLLWSCQTLLIVIVGSISLFLLHVVNKKNYEPVGDTKQTDI